MKLGRTMVVINWTILSLWLVFFIALAVWPRESESARWGGVFFSLASLGFLFVSSAIAVIIDLFSLWTKVKFLKLTTMLIVFIMLAMIWLLKGNVLVNTAV